MEIEVENLNHIVRLNSGWIGTLVKVENLAFSLREWFAQLEEKSPGKNSSL